MKATDPLLTPITGLKSLNGSYGRFFITTGLTVIGEFDAIRMV